MLTFCIKNGIILLTVYIDLYNLCTKISNKKEIKYEKDTIRFIDMCDIWRTA